jgi:hypothetical protein
LRGHGLCHLIRHSPPVDKWRNGSGLVVVTAWTNDDGRVMSANVTSMKPSLIMGFEHHEFAKEMWDHLQGDIFRTVALFCLP